MSLDVTVEGDDEVVAGLEALPGELSADLAGVVDDAGRRLRDGWRRNARRSARRHGRYYPASITNGLYQQEGSIYADVGPENALPQGRMGRGFEYGSVNQPPHYDGSLAFATERPKFIADVLEHIGYVIDDE